MKTIVISGASSGIGKTTLANSLVGLLDDSVAVKIGHHAAHAGRGKWLYPMGTTYSSLVKDHGDKRMLVIESNSILREMRPDLCIYLDGNNPKPSAMHAQQSADMRRGEQCTPETIRKIAGRLDLPEKVVRKIAWLAGARPEPFTIGILAGGKSLRMGRDKALMDIGGCPAVLRLHEMLKRQCDRVIVAARPENAPVFSGMDVVVDPEPDKGPLMGIVSILTASSTDLIGVVACDIPSIDPNLFPLLCSRIDENEIAAPAFDGTRPEPLLAVYRKSVLPHAERALANGDYRVANLFKKCRTVVVNVPDADWYFNINTAGDYERFHGALVGKGNES
jgi:molybdopterin-guanine dinucleotide biosynthesis protein A